MRFIASCQRCTATFPFYLPYGWRESDWPYHCGVPMRLRDGNKHSEIVEAGEGRRAAQRDAARCYEARRGEQ